MKIFSDNVGLVYTRVSIVDNNFRSRLPDDRLYDLMKNSHTNLTPDIKKLDETTKCNCVH